MKRSRGTSFSYWTVWVDMTETIVCLINCVNFVMHVGRLLETWK
jgi:hypothetical protein